MKNNYIANIGKKIKYVMLFVSIFGSLLLPSIVNAFPVYAQQAYENPREATGRIVCANCHLAQKPVEIEVPQGVLPDTVFEAVVDIPYDLSVKQVTGDGTKGPLNVGAVVILPEGFKLAPKDRLSEELKKATEGVVISPYSDSKQNILVVGPIPGNDHQRIGYHQSNRRASLQPRLDAGGAGQPCQSGAQYALGLGPEPTLNFRFFNVHRLALPP